jgi:hypothetical protein
VYFVTIFAIQSIAGGFLDEDLVHFNKIFDDWCIQFDDYDDALTIAQTLESSKSVSIVEITPLSYPKYFFHNLKGTVYLTRQIGDKIICAVEPHMGASFKIAICDLKTKNVRFTKTNYKTIANVEAAFTHYNDSTQFD